MPAIQVAKTDTFEQQRQKINSLGSTLFSISAGGSDLSTGNLKLGDGLLFSPSLAFVSDSSLGIYKPSIGTLGIASGSKKLVDISENSVKSYRNILIEKNSLDSLFRKKSRIKIMLGTIIAVGAIVVDKENRTNLNAIKLNEKISTICET